MSPSSSDLYTAWLRLGVGRGGHDCDWIWGMDLMGAWMEETLVEMDRHVIAFS